MNSNSNSKSNSLMGDLESIKALLEEDDLESVPEALSQALNPLEELEDLQALEDLQELEELDPLPDPLTDVEVPVGTLRPSNSPIVTFDPATGVSEPLPSADNDSQDFVEELADGVVDQLPPVLLGEDFHAATADVMERARGLINQHAHEWSPQQTDELADALRVRIDGAVEQWIQTSLAAHTGELQQQLLEAVRHELARHLEAFERS